ncbi:hypothetical protein E4U43_005330 [Claviceps pusilla]|uniref:Uncharacterized protein n=1 Tax=Claviceps pusilla TaxID=123648 RepID=A0A9P7N270_9HYPO|nr:hypothetical protein E4U43_005330 [Claviceps pusilla]
MRRALRAPSAQWIKASGRPGAGLNSTGEEAQPSSSPAGTGEQSRTGQHRKQKSVMRARPKEPGYGLILDLSQTLTISAQSTPTLRTHGPGSTTPRLRGGPWWH